MPADRGRPAPADRASQPQTRRQPEHSLRRGITGDVGRSGARVWRRSIRLLDVRRKAGARLPLDRQSAGRRSEQSDRSEQTEIHFVWLPFRLRRRSRRLAFGLQSRLFHRLAQRARVFSVKRLAEAFRHRALPDRVADRHPDPGHPLQHHPLRADRKHQRTGQHQSGRGSHAATISPETVIARCNLAALKARPDSRCNRVSSPMQQGLIGDDTRLHQRPGRWLGGIG